MVLDKNHDNHISSEEVAEESLHILDRIVSIFVYSVAVLLVGYMLFTLAKELISFFIDIWVFISTGETSIVQQDLLHTIAFTIVLVKAYRILMSYAKTHHLNIEFLIKLAIAAPIIEILFNAVSYDFKMIIFLGIFATVNLIIYLYFYKKIRKIVKDHTFELSHKERG